MLNLCNWNDAYIVVRGNITIIGNNVTQVPFKNSVLFITCITKIDGIRIDDAEDFDLSIPMFNIFEYCLDFFDTTVYGFIQKMQLILMLILLMVIILKF